MGVGLVASIVKLSRRRCSWVPAAAIPSTVGGHRCIGPTVLELEKFVGWVPEQWPSFGNVAFLVGFAVSARGCMRCCGGPTGPASRKRL